MFAASTCRVRAAALIKNLYDSYGSSGASHDDVQSGLECMTPASSFLPLVFHLWKLTFVTKRSFFVNPIHLC